MQTNAVMMNEIPSSDAARDSSRYARCIAASKRVRWDIDADVLRGRDLDS